jgi:putative phage-type endonuclease
MIAGENSLFTLVRCEDADGWLEQRTKGVGGSDVAAIMGLSPWKTPAQVWLEKTGRVESEDISDKPYVQFGNIMEPLIGRWYSEQHPDRIVRRVNAVCKSIERPWAQASLDYEVKDGAWGVLEIKTARSAKDWSEGVPPYYLTQVVHYMSVTGRPFADVAVFFRDTCEFACYRVEYDAEDGDAVRSAVDGFWHDFVEADVMPEVAGTAGEAQWLTRYYGLADEDSVEAVDGETEHLVRLYQDAAERERQAKVQKQLASTQLIARIGKHKSLVTREHRVTWVRSDRAVLDSKRLRAEMPEVADRYTTIQPTNGGIRVKEL